MKKVSYIIPGFRESHLKQSGYRKIAEYFEERGIQPIQVEIDWKYQKPARFKDFLAQFMKQYEKSRGAEVYLLGFSYGAVTAFLAESKIKPKGLILCLLSPYFEEDLKKMRRLQINFFKEEKGRVLFLKNLRSYQIPFEYSLM